jgi:hypothetical protein
MIRDHLGPDRAGLITQTRQNHGFRLRHGVLTAEVWCRRSEEQRHGLDLLPDCRAALLTDRRIGYRWAPDQKPHDTLSAFPARGAEPFVI